MLIESYLKIEIAAAGRRSLHANVYFNQFVSNGRAAGGVRELRCRALAAAAAARERIAPALF